MVVTASAGPEPVVEAARPALEATWERLTPHVHGAYANFLSSETEEDVAAIYPAKVHSRLTAVKRRYDPGNLFARNHNIRPHEARLAARRRTVAAAPQRQALAGATSPAPVTRKRPDVQAFHGPPG